MTRYYVRNANCHETAEIAFGGGFSKARKFLRKKIPGELCPFNM